MATEKVNDYGGKRKTSLWWKIKRWFRLQRDRLYRRLYIGKGGTLHNGVSWRYQLPPFGQDRDGYLSLFFDDPRAGGSISAAYDQVHSCKDSQYKFSLRMHAESLKRRGFVPAEPDDPKGFYVKFG